MGINVKASEGLGGIPGQDLTVGACNEVGA